MSARPAPGRSVAVLGATGCVGRHVSAAFARAGHSVLGVARHPAPHVREADFVPLDVAGAQVREIAQLFDTRRVEVVVNATGGWDTTEEAMVYSHVRLVDRLLEAVRLMDRPPRIVQVGSVHEYGAVPPGQDIDEAVVPRPETPYARTKLAGSEAILRADREGRVEGVVLRAVNVCGPHTTEASFLGMVLARLRDTDPSTGITLAVADARRDYIDVRDLADAVVLAAGAPVAGQVINIGRGQAVGIRELVDLLAEASGFPPEALTLKEAPVQSKGAGWTRADIRLAGQLLGWRPHITLRDSMRAMWEAATP
ncbi:NAD(P)-dependent oxidoreductase [Streptomyces griseus]|uniref:NAD-dependent epimerase/dehydratase family protein n=1 Tax=Streptomyces griseus TaxID=1911 RepID=UPI000559FD68|nr:NAD(P)-dependent oxidoreductase [Streptomyces griseus]